ncbi:MAG: ATP-binding protein [Oscillospiraceae bacterium]|jgi:hypothetical protein|nr:ATP-binding protein [Oscillospiraceae bacterium]
MEQNTINLKARETLASWIRGQRLPHAVLLEGPDPEAVTAFAHDMAKAAMCASPEPPCGVCSNCVKLDKGVHPDLTLYEGEGRARSFHIDTVRAIRSAAYIYPNEAPRKVFILKDVQDMSVQAQNALLKILEEPPDSVLFILTCENKFNLLETVRSRVAALSLDEGIQPEDHNANENPERLGQARECLDALLCGRELDALAVMAAFERDRAGFMDMMEFMRMTLEQSVLKKKSEAELPGGHAPLRLMQIIDIIDEMALSAAGNAGLSLLGTVFCARVRQVLTAAP